MDNEITAKAIESNILTIRNQQVMIDRDLAELYGVETKALNQAVKRNIERFPDDFMFQLTKEEAGDWKSQIMNSNDDISRSQIVTLKKDEDRRGQNIKYLPYAFTEQGVAMLSSVLKSQTAVEVNIQIMRAFVAMRHFFQNNAQVFAEINTIKKQLLDTNVHQKETDKKVEELFELIDKYNVKETQGIFFQGQIFDAYAKFESFIAQAKQEIILIDNYVDMSILERLAKKKKTVTVIIYTDPKTKLTAQDIQKFNAQYPTLTLKHTAKMHDRFMIIDQKILYHIGASLKDLGKKCFAFETLDASLIGHLLKNA
ncbi:MAG: ORF6N domain-containing protein [Treponema sp.]|nr:ORF6N domain-containing protein [Treponema sp.]